MTRIKTAGNSEMMLGKEMIEKNEAHMLVMSTQH